MDNGVFYPRITNQIGGNTAGATANISTGTMFLAGGNNVTLSQNANSVTISAGGGGAGDGVNILAAGTQTANTTGTVLFNDANGVTFGMANSSVITASHNGLTSQSNQAFSAGGGSSAFQTLNFANTNGVSFTNTNGSVGATVRTDYASSDHSHGNPTLNLTNLSGTTASNSAGLTLSLSASQSNQALSAGNGSFAFQTASFSNANGVSFSTSAGSAIVASHNGLTSQSNQNITAANGGFAFQTLSFSNLNGISFGTSAGSAITASHNALTTARASNDAIGLNTAQSNVTWTANSAGLSLDARGYAGTNTTFNGANVSGSMTVNSNGVNLSLSAGAGGGVTPVASASNGSFSFTTLAFSNANNVTFGTSAGSIVTASVAAPGAAAENNHINLLGANTAGNTTASGSTIGYSGINLTLSGTNGSVVNISAPATSSLSATGQVSISTNGSTISIGVPADLTLSYFNPQDAYVQVAGQQGQGTLHIQPMQAPNVQFDRLMMPIVNTNSSNSSGSHTVSFWAGIYTRNNSTLSLLHSASTSTAVTHSGTVGSYSLMSGMRLLSMGYTQTLTAGQYWVGIISRTTSGGTNGSYSQMLASQVNSSFFGHFGSSVNSTMQYTRGLGVYTATTSAMPASVAFSHISGASNSLLLRQPIFYLVSGTV